jgi:hypothetical protein
LGGSLTGGEEEIQDGGHYHPADGSCHWHGCPAWVSKVPGDELALQLQTRHEEEDGE